MSGVSAPSGAMTTTILLVEDDPLAAQSILSLLSGGFGEVKRAAGAAEALCAIEQSEIAAKLGLVISGHHTTGIGGPAFVAELHERMPELPVLVLGGDEESAADYAGEHVEFLPRRHASQQIVPLARKMLARENLPVTR